MNTKQTYISANLPVKASAEIAGIYIVYRFSVGHTGLVEINWDDLMIKNNPGKYWEFGECEYVGASENTLAISESDGSVIGINADDNKEPIYFINSNLERYVASLKLFLSKIRGKSDFTEYTLYEFKIIDSEGFERSEWSSLLRHIIDQ